jgi:zinc protease
MKKNRIRYLILFGIFSLLLSRGAYAQAQIQEVKLENGLVLLMMEEHISPLVAVQVYYHVGSKDEAPGQTGLNALCARLYQKGTALYPEGEYAGIIQGGGGTVKNQNDLDLTYFGAKVPASQLDTVLFLEADRMQNIEPTYEKMLLTRDALYRERLAYIENYAYGPLDEELFSLAYQSHPYGHPIFGWAVDQANISFEEFRDFYRQYYQASNAVIVVVGDFDSDKIAKKVKLLFEKIVSTPMPIRKKIIEPVQRGERKETMMIGSEIPLVLLGYHIPAVGDNDIHPLRLLFRALRAGSTSRLYTRLVMKEKSALDINGAIIELEDPGLIAFYAVMNQGIAASVGEQQIVEEIDRMKNEPLTAAELDRLKNRFEVDYYRQIQSIDQKAAQIGFYYITTGRPELMNSQVEMARRVSVDDIINIANKYLKNSNRTVITMQPQSSGGSAGRDKTE